MVKKFTGWLGVTSKEQAAAIRKVGNERLLRPDTVTKVSDFPAMDTLSFVGIYKVTAEITPAHTDGPETLLGEGKAKAFIVSVPDPANPDEFALAEMKNPAGDLPDIRKFFNFTEFTFMVDEFITGYMEVYSKKMFAVPLGGGGSASPAIVTQEISARTGSLTSQPPQTAGQGSVDLLEQITGGIVVASSTIVYNWTIATFEIDSWVHVSQDVRSDWWIDAVDCEEATVQTPTVT